MCHEPRHTQTNEADESAIPAALGGERSESAFAKMILSPVHKLVAFIGRQARREELHDRGIGVHARERLPIGLVPFPQDEPLGLEICDQRLNCCRSVEQPFARQRNDRRNRE